MARYLSGIILEKNADLIYVSLISSVSQFICFYNMERFFQSDTIRQQTLRR